MHIQLRALKSLLVLAGLVVAMAASAQPYKEWSQQFSRWTSRPQAGVYDRMFSGGPDGSTLVTPYDGTRNSSPMRSFDGGITWERFSIDGQLYWDYAIAPRDRRVWYAQDGLNTVLRRTADGGGTWSVRGVALPPKQQVAFLAVSADPDVVYRELLEFEATCDFMCPAKSGTLQVTRDGGATWRDIGSPQSFQRAFPSPIDPQLVYAVGTNGLQRSTDQGATWTPIPIPFGTMTAALAGGKLALDPVDPAIAYLEARDTDSWSPLFSTRDGGATWTSITLPAGTPRADPVQKGRAYLFTRFFGTYETRDAGLTWAQVEPAVYTSINENVTGVTLRDGRRVAVGPRSGTLRELDLTHGALALASDLWWKPDESGWGLTITHRASTQTFVGWYGYDAEGMPVWRVIPGGTWSDRTFTGDIYETTATAYFGARFDPANVKVRKVGTATLAFESEQRALFSYRIGDGAFVEKRIERQQFGPAVNVPAVQESYADLWWNAAESGWGIAINHQGDNLFAVWFAYDDSGKPAWVVLPDAKLVVVGGVPSATGDVYATRGPAASATFDPSQVVRAKVGSATLSFPPNGPAVLTSNVYGRSELRQVTRQPF